MVHADRTLADMLATAMRERDTAVLRQQPCRGHEGSQDFINQWKALGSGFFAGTLFQFTEGELPVGFSFDPTAKELSLSVLTQLQVGTHVLKSALHFGVLDNHVVLMPTSAIRASDFQDYVNSLLTETGTLTEGGTVVLADESAAELREKDWSRVKGITLRSRLTHPSLTETEGEPNQTSAGILKTAVAGLSRGRDLLFGTLNAAQAAAMERVAVSMTIRYEGRTERLDTTLLDHVASILKDDPTSKFQLDIEGIGLVAANKIRVAQNKSIAHDDGRPVFDVVAEKMHFWLRELIESQRVRP